MLDGKRYYAMFPDEDPALRPRIRAVLDALRNLDKAFRQHLEAFQPNNLDRDCRTSRSPHLQTAALILVRPLTMRFRND